MSRHAKNKLRDLPVIQREVEAVISNPHEVTHDEKGNTLYLGAVRDIPICVVVALDEPDLIVTIFRRERW